jgi:hypothetical protein
MVDAEGCISIGAANHITKAGNSYTAYMLRIQIANTSKKLMDWLVENFGGVIYTKKRNPNQKSLKVVYQWFTKGGANGQEKFLLSIFPYLLIKREQALIALEFIRSHREQNPEKRNTLYEKMRSLNRGESVTTNTQDSSNKELMIEPELISDDKSDPVVT